MTFCFICCHSRWMTFDLFDWLQGPHEHGHYLSDWLCLRRWWKDGWCRKSHMDFLCVTTRTIDHVTLDILDNYFRSFQFAIRSTVWMTKKSILYGRESLHSSSGCRRVLCYLALSKLDSYVTWRNKAGDLSPDLNVWSRSDLHFGDSFSYPLHATCWICDGKKTFFSFE